MNKIASYLQQHISGEVLSSDSTRQFFSTDASVLSLKPNLVVYPRHTNDVRKVARFTWQLAEKGHVLPITARGSGTDLTGAAIGKGIVMVFPAHLNQILEIDTKQRLVRVQPGINFKSLQETLHTHGLFLPPYPASYTYSTVGGAIANNAAGDKSLKYGSMRNWVQQLEVVLANGEVIETGRISKKELNKKKGLANLEGELYRTVDGLLSDSQEVIDSTQFGLSKNSVGYALSEVGGKDGSVDLTPLFVGSQGTLGIITEAILRVEAYTPQTSLVVSTFDSIENALDAVDKLQTLGPSALEMVDDNLLKFAEKHHGDTTLRQVVEAEAGLPKVVLFAEFDDVNQRINRKKAAKAHKQLQGLATAVLTSEDYDDQQRLWSVRQAASAVVNYDNGGKVALPIIDDGIVPPSAFHQYVTSVYDLFARHHLEVAVWGHIGDANLHMWPLLDLRKLGDRQKVFKLMEEHYRLVTKLGGSIAAQHNDGRLRAPYVILQYGADVIQMYEQMKQSFDPYGTLNPGVKVGTDVKQLVDMLRKDYSLAHWSEHLPRT